MTRETKIGLLVGLAFIIVIGILLSDHFTSATQPHQAALTTTIDGVLGSTRTLGPQTQQPGPLDLPTVEPRVPIVVQPEQAQPQVHVEVGATRSGQRVIDVTEQPQIPSQPELTQIPTVERGNINELAAMFRPIETVVAPAEHNPPTAATTATTTQSPPVTATAKTYTAESGDTLGKMASKAMGANTRANREAMMKANPRLAENPDRVVVGEKYVVPVATAAAVTTLTPAPTPTPVVIERPEPSAATNAVAMVEYVAKSGDYISKIAKEQCGTASNAMVQQILELNKDVLKGTDKIKIGMKLKLPARQVASR
jgi:nucleoid-associated protein YgaU